ncbi:MAG TPA: maltose alpha-D-glucosyltransferase [Candidatus Sumerlaeota bacterium]|nr:maltose alpha-D-glucosyltransferase [Candidatus Sumerlaeota bacterium]
MARTRKPPIELDHDPQWYKDAIIYELHVRAFHDSDGDGYGDFRGLAQKLDYVSDLGVTAIWLLPFYPSPLRDDGYDIANYMDVHPRYGNLRDFKTLLAEAEKRGIRIISELVLNHTSDLHPWFQRARQAPPGSPHRDWYVWEQNPDRYQEARIIFQDYEHSNWTWDHVANAYYWHRFYSHQPDLNFDNPAVRRELIKVLDYWFAMGVSGMRLDAVPYLYEQDGTNCENLPRTHEFLKELRRHLDRKFDGRMLLAEANQWPEDSREYFGDGDECHMAFHFPLMPRMFMAVQLEDRFPIIDILDQTPAIPDNAQWALFLRNHDELTLEMVTDEERDYMYRAYASDLQARVNLGIRRRLAPLLGNNRRKIELMNGLLFSLPGTPVLYYGDEIGMGDNIYLGDRDSVRTPMQWSADRNAGFSRANPQQLYLPVITDYEYRYETINVETQRNNPHSLLWWMKRLIALRKNYRAFSRGTMDILHPDNRKVLAFIRRHDEEIVLVVANLSRFVQCLELDLKSFEGMTPVELFGQNPFPRIGELPYFITLGPHSFYWFALERSDADARRQSLEERPLPQLTVAGAWDHLFRPERRAAFERILPEYLALARWFGGKARKIKSTCIVETIPVPIRPHHALLVMLEVEYTDGDPETYLLALAWADGERAQQLQTASRHLILARLDVGARGGEPRAGVLYDAFCERAFNAALLTVLARRRKLVGLQGHVLGLNTPQLARLLAGDSPDNLESHVIRGEQSNTSVIYGERFILKLFRRIERGINPDIELTRCLTARRFAPIAPLAGWFEYVQGRREPIQLGLLQAFVVNEGDAWQYTLDAMGWFMEQVLSHSGRPLPPAATGGLVELSLREPPEEARESIGHYLEMARLLGERTAQMHQALAADPADPAFKPESFSQLYQRSLYQSMRNLIGQTFQLLDRQLRALPESTRDPARDLLARQDELLARLRAVLQRRITAKRIRTHGDYHLGQVLYTGKDFVILDFEGEPSRSLTERRLKRSALRDVAGMLRSFHYAAYTVCRNLLRDGMIHEEDRPRMQQWARFWYRWVAAAFLAGYLPIGQGAGFLPRTHDELQLLIDAYMIDKCVYELKYELNNRPDWVEIPLKGLLNLLESTLAPHVE